MSAAVKVEIRQLPHGEGLALPAYQSAHAAGLDLLAAVPEGAPMVLAPGKYALVPTALTIALPPGYEAQVRPRSGLAAKHGITVLNSPGTIDADYRGEIGVLLINHGDAPFPIRRGERIAQMVIAAVRDGGAGSRGGAFHHGSRHRRFWLDRPLADETGSRRLNNQRQILPNRFPQRYHCAFFCIAVSRSRSGLLPAESRWGYCDSIRERRVEARRA